jgi:hypothetical protein
MQFDCWYQRHLNACAKLDFTLKNFGELQISYASHHNSRNIISQELNCIFFR